MVQTIQRYKNTTQTEQLKQIATVSTSTLIGTSDTKNTHTQYDKICHALRYIETMQAKIYDTTIKYATIQAEQLKRNAPVSTSAKAIKKIHTQTIRQSTRRYPLAKMMQVKYPSIIRNLSRRPS